MAHGDTLIFLTTITWIFLLFLFVYLFFVVFFLPLFYKQTRIRSVLKGSAAVIEAYESRKLATLPFLFAVTAIDLVRVLSRKIWTRLTFIFEIFYYAKLGTLAGRLSTTTTNRSNDFGLIDTYLPFLLIRKGYKLPSIVVFAPKRTVVFRVYNF